MEKAGGRVHALDEAQIAVESAEIKYRDPFGVVIDVSARGWYGAKKDV